MSNQKASRPSASRGIQHRYLPSLVFRGFTSEENESSALTLDRRTVKYLRAMKFLVVVCLFFKERNEERKRKCSKSNQTDCMLVPGFPAFLWVLARRNANVKRLFNEQIIFSLKTALRVFVFHS